MNTTSKARVKSKPYTSNENHNRHWVDLIHSPIAAWTILGFSLLTTLIAWAITNDYADKRAKERF